MVLALIGVALTAGTSSGREGIRPHLDTEGLPEYLRDRGVGVPASQFGIYVQKGQFIVYPYFEYYRDSDAEYAPNELGLTQDTDYRGKYEAFEYLLYLGYGISRRLMLEVEAAYIDAALETSPDDPSGLPPKIEESGLGDVESQLRWRWREETKGGPELFSYFETVFPIQDKGSLIGTTDWEFQLGFGAIRGFSWGTLTGRLAIEYEAAEKSVALGEAAVEYLKRLSPKWRFFGSIEGTGDEVEAITEFQWHFARFACLKLNSAFGVTSKAPDWAPEVGVLFSF
ncbi:MAG: hypothetical protein OEO21_10165 [Candidatus Krumholzibacteria bacterium]|nr:hypothetical protein [Candidatus Krumholzibacteria bacterium]